MMDRLKIILSAIKKTYSLRRHNCINDTHVYCDMVRCCLKYHVGTNHYVDYQMWKMSQDEKTKTLQKLHEVLMTNAAWTRMYNENWKFLNEYSAFMYETSDRMRLKRKKAYIKQYGLPESFSCQYGVKIIREHNGWGKLRAGENLCVARDVDIDITGDLTFGDDVNISEGAKFLTHAHDYDNILGKEIISSDMAYVSPLVVGDDVHFGARCIILASCNHIGSHSVIGAGAIVTHDVPEWAIVAGNPARVIKMREKKEAIDESK